MTAAGRFRKGELRHDREQSGMEVKKTRKIVFAAVTGIITGFQYAAGSRLDRQDTLDLRDASFYLSWLVISVAAASIVYVIWWFANKLWTDRMTSGRKEENRSHGGVELTPLFLHLFYTGVLLLCWLPALLSIVPGVFSYDAYAEWEQVKTGLITSHHPVLHVLLVGGLLEGFHRLTGSYNVGICVYSLLQMFLVANVLAFTVTFMKKRGIGRGGRLLSLFFYGLSPVLALFSICTTKDVLFAACQLLLMLFVLRLTGEQERFFTERKAQAGFVLAALGTMILRNNGLYIALVMLAVLFFFCRKYWRRYVLLTAVTLLLYGVYAGPLYAALSVTPGGIEEMLPVPIQQLARVYHYEYDSLDAGDLELLYRVLPRENLEAYKPTVADPVKSGFDREGFAANRREFFELWMRWGLEHPLTYINSFLVTTVDFWYPGAVMDGYKDPYGRSSYFDYRVAEPGQEVVLLKGLHEFYEKLSWDKAAQQKPLAFLALSPGWYFLLFLVAFMYFWCYKKRKLMLPGLVPLLTMATVLLGPMALVRYVLIFFFGFPLIAAMFLKPEAFLAKE